MDKRKLRRGGVLSYALNIILAIVCILLFLQNKELKHTLGSTTSVTQSEPLQSGDNVESFSVTTLDGNPNEIIYTDLTKRYLFFVLSTTCPHCEKTLPAWKTIAKAQHDNCEIIGISLHNLEQTKKYIETRDVGLYVASVANDTSFSRKYKISGVPATILINGNGTVKKVWIGALTQEHTSEIQGLMSASTALRN